MAMINGSNRSNNAYMDSSFYYFIKARFYAGLFHRAEKEHTLTEN